MTRPLIIGITGGIGSGKTTLSNKLRELNYHVYDSDKEARRIQNENPEVIEQIKKIFGKDIYSYYGLNRAEVANKAFNDKYLLLKLNLIVHPVVRKDFEIWIEKHLNERLIFIESAVLFNNGLNNLVDKVILVDATEEVRIERVIKRDHVSREQVLARIKNQINISDLELLVNYIIKTEDNQQFDSKVNLLIEELLKSI